MIRKKHVMEILILFCIYAGLASPLLNQPVASASLEILLINEVMYHPSDNENTNEWIELYNPTSESFDIEGWMIGDEKETDTIHADTENGDGRSSIPPGGYAIITDKGTTVYDSYSLPDETVKFCVDDSTLCGYGLNNQQEKLVFSDSEGTMVDAIEWGQDYEDVPGTPFSGVPEGNSLARYPNVDTDDSAVDFFKCDSPTPGGENIPMIPEEQPGQDITNEGSPEETMENVASFVLITEFFYDTHPNIDAEYIRLWNPTNKSIDVSGWYLTNKPWKQPEDQSKIFLPEHTLMMPGTSWVLTKDASAFLWETAKLPDYEYGRDALPEVPQLGSYRTVSFSSTGGFVGLYNSLNGLVDLLCYGETDESVSGWEGPSIPSSGEGNILRRNNENGTWVDTDSASDWIHERIYHIGQSEFLRQTVPVTGEITTFVSPDCSYETISGFLRSAQHSIDINMYEFTNPFLYQELLDALQRNVSIRIFMEGSPIGGIDDRELFILGSLASHGGQIRFMVNDNEKQVNARYPFDHAKYLIIDNETVIVESCNWAKTGVPKDPSYGNREWGIVVQSREVAAVFWQVFQDDWSPSHPDSRSLEAMNKTFFSDFALDFGIQTGSYHPKFKAETFTEQCTVTPIFSPDTSEQALLDAIDSATTSIYIQQLYIYKDWGERPSPLVEHLINKSGEGVQVLVILNDQGSSDESAAMLNETKEALEASGIKVKLISSDWSPFSTVHNKGMIIDNTTVLVSSINWNEQSVRKNREAGLLITSPEVATYYATVFFSDWNLQASRTSGSGSMWTDYKYLILVAVVVCVTLVFIARDWRKRKWA